MAGARHIHSKISQVESKVKNEWRYVSSTIGKDRNGDGAAYYICTALNIWGTAGWSLKALTGPFPPKSFTRVSQYSPHQIGPCGSDAMDVGGLLSHAVSLST